MAVCLKRNNAYHVLMLWFIVHVSVPLLIAYIELVTSNFIEYSIVVTCWIRDVIAEVILIDCHYI